MTRRAKVSDCEAPPIPLLECRAIASIGVCLGGTRLIRTEHLTRRFGTMTAVDDVSFEVPAGEIFAFLGPNGAGKTTTIRMLTTLLKPTSGVVQLDGMDIARQPHEARRRFGIVFQDSSLDVELTARENMVNPCGAVRG